MRHRQLPHELRERVRRFVQYKWLATRGVDEESILKSLPADLRRDIQSHLCLGLVRRVRSIAPLLLVLLFAKKQLSYLLALRDSALIVVAHVHERIIRINIFLFAMKFEAW